MLDDNTKDELKKALPLYVEQITRKSRKGNYICPICNSGTGKNKTGAFSVFDDGKAWQCFSCHNAGDIFKLIELVENKTSFADQAARAVEIAGIKIDSGQDMKQTKPAKEEIIPAAGEILPGHGRYYDYITKCHANAASAANYFKERGFTEEIVNRFNLGYDAIHKAIVIPYDKSNNYYTTRSIAGKTFNKPPAEEAGPEPIYNKHALNDNKPCFVCEGQLDAISIMAINSECNAISLGGTGSDKLIKAIQKQRPSCTLILNFDDDDAGRDATEKAAGKLTAENVDFIIAEYQDGGAIKDANDRLRADAEQLKKDTDANIARAEEKAEARQAQRLIDLNQTRANNLLADFLETNALDMPCVSTGFKTFDEEMDGGLYPGLYVLGAISSMGKTSFMLQLADQIAAGKKDVLFFSLEMGAHELIAKSLSRFSYIEAFKTADNAVYTRTITNVERRADMTMNQRISYDKAVDEYYLNVSNNLWYFESIGDIGVEDIKARIKKHAEVTGRVPIIFIDYLQILKPINETWTEKRNTDKAVLELRKLAREYNTTIFIISSLNRSSYKGDISMDAFKESGAIEYGSDVLLGLQPRGMAAGSYKKDEKNNIELVEDTKSRELRELELKVLKNRTGRTGQRINFEYNAKFNYFEEEEEFTPGWQKFATQGISDIY